MTHISARGRWLPWVTPWVMAVMSGLLVFFAQMGPSTVGAGPALAAPTTTFGKASHVYDRATQQLSDTPGATNPQDRSSRSSAARAPWEIWVVRHKPVSSGAAEAAGGAGDHIVLGLEAHGLEATAAKVGGRTLLSDPEWMGTLQRAVGDSSTKFTVSLDGLSGSSTYSQIAGAAQRGAASGAHDARRVRRVACSD